MLLIASGGALDLNEVHDLIVSGSQVHSDGLRDRLESAEMILGAIDHDNRLMGCIALKRAEGWYRTRVFARAGVADLSSSEIGWCVVAPEHRGRGISKLLLGELLNKLGRSLTWTGRRFFATADPSGPMARTLQHYSFDRLGGEWSSEIDSTRRLALFVSR